MKPFRKIIALVLVFATLVLSGCASNGKKDSESSTDGNQSQQGNVKNIVADGKSDYVIVVPMGNAGMFDEGYALSGAIEMATGARLKVVQDTHKEQKKEILVGVTSRNIEGNFSDGLVNPDDFSLVNVGDKILFYSATVNGVREAVKLFEETYLSKAESNTLNLPENMEHKVNSDSEYLTLFESGKSDYVIVSRPSEEKYAREVQNAFEKLTSVKLPIVTGSNKQGKEIVVGDGQRSEGTSLEKSIGNPFEGKIAANGEKLLIVGGGDVALSNTVSYFVKNIEDFMFKGKFMVASDYEYTKNFGKSIAKEVITSINANPTKVYTDIKVETSRVYTPDGSEDAWYYTHHPFITTFKGDFYIFYSSGRRNEDDCGQRIMMAKSHDCKNWTVDVLVDSIDGKYAEWVMYCKGVYVDGDTMNVYFEGYEFEKDVLRTNPDGTPLRPLAENHRAIPYGTYYLNTKDGKNFTKPEKMGRFKGGNQSPEVLPDGRIIWAGYGSLSYTDNKSGLEGWKDVTLKLDEGAQKPKAITESGFYRTNDGTLFMLSRTNGGCMVCAASFDNGTTWTDMYTTKMRDYVSKFQFGTLPDGRYYYIGNTSSSRSELVLMTSENGVDFDKWYYLGSSGYNMMKQGMYKVGVYGYPNVCFDEEYMYIVYSLGKESLEVTKVKLSDIGVKSK